MPNPHHRKKHKHFQPPPHKAKAKSKGSAAPVIAIFGGLVGLAIVFFGIQGTIPWLVVGAAVGAAIGWLLGRRVDQAAEKNK